ncbi:MAG: hypothetical protein ACRDTS_25100, partial [Mycobacterium sp.]
MKAEVFVSLMSSIRRRTRVLAACAVAAAIALPICATAGTASAATQEPCDIYAAGGTPCETAHSTI